MVCKVETVDYVAVRICQNHVHMIFNLMPSGTAIRHLRAYIRMVKASDRGSMARGEYSDFHIFGHCQLHTQMCRLRASDIDTALQNVVAVAQSSLLPGLHND